MVFIDSISELQYYNQQPGIPCFCEVLIFPSDLMLQSAFTKGAPNYILTVYVYSADGLTQYEDASAYFTSFFAVNPITNEHYFTAKLNGYSPAMCTHKCWILRVLVEDAGAATRFDKYTERYCQFSCCDVARDIVISQSGLVTTDVVGTTSTASNPKVSACGDRYITLRTKYDCYDKFTGAYYGEPNTILTGSFFQYENISSFRGRVVRRPREITREYSYNCRLQRVESAATFLFEGFEFFPAWKMNEIEGQLHSSEIYIDDREYQFNGGTVFEQLHDCLEAFKLSTIMNDCIQRQVFGCDTVCSPVNFDGSNMAFVIPSRYFNGTDSPAQPGDWFYSETGVLIAETYAQLLDYMRSLDGVTAVTEIGLSLLDCTPYAVFTVTGTGYIPTSFYFERVLPDNRIFGRVYDSIGDICDEVPVVCDAPDLGTPVVEDDTCAAPSLGTPVVEDMASEAVTIEAFGDWSNSGITDAYLYNYQVTMNIEVTNPTMLNLASPPADRIVYGDHIATISASGRPNQGIALDSTNSNMPADTALFIDTNGFIYFSGTGVTDGTGTTITLLNIQYNVQ